jgi:hypothetical protein
VRVYGNAVRLLLIGLVPNGQQTIVGEAGGGFCEHDYGPRRCAFLAAASSICLSMPGEAYLWRFRALRISR